MKMKLNPYIVARDYPNEEEEQVCCYCEQRFISTDPRWKRTYEHLDCNHENNSGWNIAYAHFKCNQDKKTNVDYQFIAHDLIKKNKEWDENNDFEFTRERNKIFNTDEPTEIDLNVAHRKITEEFLAEKLSVDEKLDFIDTINCITLRCENQTGHGSKQSVRNYLDVLSCSEGKYRKFKEGGKTWISKRLGQ
ncbi:MAG: hypothetical protein IIA82_08115 [Thaumarchaeota archaeon]|nr:hypothetical protein [Nitrososphaerota archaeon]